MRRSSDAHDHPCDLGCGRYFTPCPNDKCPGDWTCPTCEMEALDLYIEHMAHDAEEQTDARLRERK